MTQNTYIVNRKIATFADSEIVINFVVNLPSNLTMNYVPYYHYKNADIYCSDQLL